MEVKTARRSTERRKPGTGGMGECRTVFVDESKVARAMAAIPANASVDELAAVFGVLADATRIRIVMALSREELCVCDLARIVGRSMPATSHQLSLLRQRGLVRYRMDGKLAYYTLTGTWLAQTLHERLRLIEREATT